MKTKEFVKKVEELGYKVKAYDFTYNIINNGLKLSSIDKFIPMRISTNYYEHDKLCDEDKEKLFDLMVEYAKTPIKSRKEEKKFYLKHKWLRNYHWLLYLYRAESGNLGITMYKTSVDVPNMEKIQTKFTLKEIEEIKERFDTDLADFEMVEVE